jgi:hypothetical protein
MIWSVIDVNLSEQASVVAFVSDAQEASKTYTPSRLDNLTVKDLDVIFFSSVFGDTLITARGVSLLISLEV